MERLSDERVVEIARWFDANHADDPMCNGAGDGHDLPSGYLLEGDVTALAREVLELREASSALIGKLDAVGPVLTSMFAERQLVRGRGVYDGPTYGEELEALRALLPAPPALGGDNGD